MDSVLDFLVSNLGKNDSDNESGTSSPPGEKASQGTSYFPIEVHSDSICIASTDLSRGPCPTVFFGLVTDSYTDESWTVDVAELGRLFKFDTNDTSLIRHLKLYPEKFNRAKLDMKRSAESFRQLINDTAPPFDRRPLKHLRLVGMGNGTHSFLFEGLQHFLKQIGSKDMSVQFVSLGDTNDHDWLVFCKTLIGRGDVAELEFFNPLDYTPFGYYKVKE